MTESLTVSGIEIQFASPVEFSHVDHIYMCAIKAPTSGVSFDFRSCRLAPFLNWHFQVGRQLLLLLLLSSTLITADKESLCVAIWEESKASRNTTFSPTKLWALCVTLGVCVFFFFGPKLSLSHLDAIFTCTQ